MKICTKCKELKKDSDYSRQKSKRGGYILKAECRLCLSERFKEWRLKNIEYNRSRVEKYRKENPKKIKDKSKEWYCKNLIKCKKQNKEYLSNNPEYRKNLRSKNPENFDNKRRSYKKKSIENLSDSYIISLMSKNLNIKISEININDDAIEAKRLILRIKKRNKK